MGQLKVNGFLKKTHFFAVRLKQSTLKKYCTKESPSTKIFCVLKGIVKFEFYNLIYSELHGIVLVLDGAVQCTSFDEFAYQEMIAYLPINSHPSPNKV